MDDLYAILRFLHLLSFVFMSIPLFNLIVVNERAMMGKSFDYSVDRYMENIIRRGAKRCYVFQTSVLVTGILLLVVGPLGIGALLQSWILAAKTVLLLVLMSLLSYVHFSLQPRIEDHMAKVGPDSPAPEDFAAVLKPPRALRKRLATFCLFLVSVTIILGLQVYEPFNPLLTLGLTALAGLFAWRANSTLIRFGWI
jgi:uncharacterized membrane protein